jgi:hypothetical protein
MLVFGGAALFGLTFEFDVMGVFTGGGGALSRSMLFACADEDRRRARAPPPRLFPPSFNAFYLLEYFEPLDYQGVLKTISFHVRDLLSTCIWKLRLEHGAVARPDAFVKMTFHH